MLKTCVGKVGKGWSQDTIAYMHVSDVVPKIFSEQNNTVPVSFVTVLKLPKSIVLRAKQRESMQ